LPLLRSRRLDWGRIENMYFVPYYPDGENYETLVFAEGVPISFPPEMCCELDHARANIYARDGYVKLIPLEEKTFRIFYPFGTNGGNCK